MKQAAFTEKEDEFQLNDIGYLPMLSDGLNETAGNEHEFHMMAFAMYQFMEKYTKNNNIGFI